MSLLNIYVSLEHLCLFDLSEGSAKGQKTENGIKIFGLTTKNHRESKLVWLAFKKKKSTFFV